MIKDYKAKTIDKKIEVSLQNWEIEKLFVIIVDKASGNDVVINMEE